MDTEDIVLGRRFVCDGHIGTVRYVGPVPPTEGTWLGVEWDDASRGKHDGTHEGRQYFKTSHPSSGSFLRPKKADFGISCLSAIAKKYRKVGTCATQNQPDDLFIITANNSILPVEAVGYDKIEAKQSQLNNLREVAIACMQVSNAGPDGELLNAVPSIVELDLSKNLLSSWEEIARITRQLQNLRSLNLSNNQLVLPGDPVTLQEAFASLKIMIAMKVGCSWLQMLHCSQMWPGIMDLGISFNGIRTLDVPPSDRLKNLEHLDLEGNDIELWCEVLKLGHLPKLRFLNLNENKIDGIVFCDISPGEKTQLFPVLETLYLQNNELKKWSDVNELNKMAFLSRLDLKNNPLWQSEKHQTVWQLIIARLDGLKVVNRCTVSSVERRGAELDYLKKYGKEWLIAEKSSSTDLKVHFLNEHPRYQKLIQVHGAPEEGELKPQSTALKSSLITIKIFCPKVVDCKPIVKKLPGSMTVQKVRSLMQRLFKLERHAIIMKSTSSKKSEHFVELSNDLRELSFYVEDGDEITVDW